MDVNYQAFMIVAGVLGKVAIIATLLERGLSVIFEHEWFVRLTTKEVPDPNDNTKKMRQSRFPGLKGAITLLGAYLICSIHQFDVLDVVFNPLEKPDPDALGIILTSFIVAGGSAGAILIFQGYLNLGKQGRDAMIEAQRVSADADKAEAEARKRMAGAAS